MQFPPPVPASGRESFILLVLLARGTHFYYEISPVFLIIFTHWICNVYWIWGVVKLLPWRKSSIMVLIDRKALHEISLKKIYNVSTAQFWPQSVLKNHLILSLQQLTPLRMKGGLFFLLSDRLGRWQSFPGLKYTADMKGHCTERLDTEAVKMSWSGCRMSSTAPLLHVLTPSSYLGWLAITTGLRFYKTMWNLTLNNISTTPPCWKALDLEHICMFWGLDS